MQTPGSFCSIPPHLFCVAIRRRDFLAGAVRWIYGLVRHLGAVAHLVERFVRNEQVRGSSPLSSTTIRKALHHHDFSMNPDNKSASERKFGSAEVDFRVYQRLAEMMSQGKHGRRWNIREFSSDPVEIERLDPFGALRLDRPFVPIRNEGTQQAIAREIFGSFLIKPESLRQLTATIGEFLSKGPVRQHLDSGGSVAFPVGPHKSYADIPVSGMASGQLGEEVARNQTEFTHRQVALQEFAGFKIIDDGILRTANVLQTFPDSKSGKDDAFAEIRDHANMLAVKEYTRLVRLGGRFSG